MKMRSSLTNGLIPVMATLVLTKCLGLSPTPRSTVRVTESTVHNTSSERELCNNAKSAVVSSEEQTGSDSSSDLALGSYSRSRYELENKCVIHSGCVVVVWSLVELFVEFDCCVNYSRVAWLAVVR